MALLRQLLLLPLAIAAGLTTVQPIDDPASTNYGCWCGDEIVPAMLGAFVPAALIAFVALVRLFAPSTSMPDALPTATLHGTGHRRWRARYRELNARAARDVRGGRTQRICAWVAFVLGMGMLLPSCDGPGKLEFAVTHLALWAVVLMPPFTAPGVRPDRSAC